MAVGSLLVLLTACTTEYHGTDSGIDPVLWRQVSTVEDPLSNRLYDSGVSDPREYLLGLPGTAWDGTIESAEAIDMRRGGIVLYDSTTSVKAADVSIFIASGPRTGAQQPDAGSRGPSEVYTCYRMHATFDRTALMSAERQTFHSCPSALVALLSPDAAFASAEVFDG